MEGDKHRGEKDAGEGRELLGCVRCLIRKASRGLWPDLDEGREDPWNLGELSRPRGRGCREDRRSSQETGNRSGVSEGGAGHRAARPERGFRLL